MEKFPVNSAALQREMCHIGAGTRKRGRDFRTTIWPRRPDRGAEWKLSMKSNFSAKMIAEMLTTA